MAMTAAGAATGAVSGAMRRTAAATNAPVCAVSSSSSSARLRRSGKNLGRHVPGSHRRDLGTTAMTAASNASASSSASAAASTPSPGGYASPFKPGQSPVYDAAVAYLKEHSKRKEAQIGDVRKQLQELRGAGGSSASSTQLEHKLLGLEIAKAVNDPETVWRFRHGQGQLPCSWQHGLWKVSRASPNLTCRALISGDMSQPVYRYLAEQAWRNDGSLGVLVCGRPSI